MKQLRCTEEKTMLPEDNVQIIMQTIHEEIDNQLRSVETWNNNGRECYEGMRGIKRVIDLLKKELYLINNGEDKITWKQLLEKAKQATI